MASNALSKALVAASGVAAVALVLFYTGRHSVAPVLLTQLLGIETVAGVALETIALPLTVFGATWPLLLFAGLALWESDGDRGGDDTG